MQLLSPGPDDLLVDGLGRQLVAEVDAGVLLDEHPGGQGVDHPSPGVGDRGPAQGRQHLAGPRGLEHGDRLDQEPYVVGEPVEPLQHGIPDRRRHGQPGQLRPAAVRGLGEGQQQLLDGERRARGTAEEVAGESRGDSLDPEQSRGQLTGLVAVQRPQLDDRPLDPVGCRGR
jgi:hypothetical protein